MNNLFAPLSIAFAALNRARGRALLTVTGMAIGIALVIIVLSAGEGLKGIIFSEIASFGDNWINIDVKVPNAGRNSNDNAQALAGGVAITTLTADDAAAIEALPDVALVYGGITSQGAVAYGGEQRTAMIFGVGPSYIDIDQGTIAQGRFFTQEEDSSSASVVVLGSKLADTFFGNREPLDTTITISGKSYRVIGVMEERGASGFVDMDTLVYLPLQTVQKKMLGVDHVLFIVASLTDEATDEAVAEEVRLVLRDRHDITDPEKDDFAVTTMEEAQEIVGTIVTAVTALLIALAVISLIVGGVGIMNVMYVSVTERTFEIGLRKAVGATNKDIVWQFLTEAVVLTLFGGVIGVVIGAGISFLISVGASAAGLNWVFAIPTSAFVLSLSFSAAVGILFGIAPARAAARLDPITALRADE